MFLYWFKKRSNNGEFRRLKSPYGYSEIQLEKGVGEMCNRHTLTPETQGAGPVEHLLLSHRLRARPVDDTVGALLDHVALILDDSPTK